MGVKYCPKCKRINIVTNWIPRFWLLWSFLQKLLRRYRYVIELSLSSQSHFNNTGFAVCMWGCGSLENEPELSENYLERQKQIKEIYYSEKELVLVGNNGQLKLF